MAYSASTAPRLLQEHKTKARTSQNSFKSCSCVGTDKQTGGDLPDWGTYVTYVTKSQSYIFICDFFFKFKTLFNIINVIILLCKVYGDV